jgi:hypothetical protein
MHAGTETALIRYYESLNSLYPVYGGDQNELSLINGQFIFMDSLSSTKSVSREKIYSIGSRYKSRCIENMQQGAIMGQT